MTGTFVAAVQTSEIGLRPVLPLGQPLDIGHVGTVDDAGVFSHKGTISSMLGLNSLGPELPPQATDHLAVTVTSGNDVRVGFGAGAKTDGVLAEFADLEAKASIDFGSSNSFFLALKGIRIRQLAEPQLLLNAMLAAYDQRPRRWHKDWVFVDRVGIASNLTVILAREAKTTVLLKASGKAKVAAAAEVDLAAGFTFVASSKGVTQITSARKLVAFYSAYRVRDGLFSGPEITQVTRARAYGLDLDQYPADSHLVTAVDDAFTPV